MKRNKRQTPAKTTTLEASSALRPWHYALGLFLAFFIAMEAYAPALNGPFVFDDIYALFHRPEAPTATLRNVFIGLRPLVNESFLLNYWVSKLDPYLYHLVNVLLHFGSAVMAGFIVRKVLELAGESGWRREVLSVFGGMLFLLHPLQTESVSYVTSRSEAQSIFFFFAAFTVFLYRRSIAISWRAAIGVLLLYAAAVMTKEHAAVLPALLLFTDYFWNPGFSFRGILKNWRVYAPIAIGGVAALAFVWHVLSRADTAGFRMKDLPWYRYLFTQFRAVWVYIRLFFAPYGQNLDYDYPVSRTILDHGAIFGLIGLVAVLGAAYIYRRRFPVASYGILVFLLLLAPTSSVVPIKDTLVERRMYMPMIGMILVVCEVLRHWKTSRALWGGTMAAVVLAAAVLTHQRNQVWSSSIALWQNTLEGSPGNARAHFQLGFAYYNEQRCDEAIREYEMVPKLQGGHVDQRYLLDAALAYDCAGKPGPALDKLLEAASINKDANVYALMGMIYGKRGDRQQALEALDQAEKVDPNYDMIYMYRGNVYAVAAEYEKAAAQYSRALAIHPDNQLARDGLQAAQSRLNEKTAK